MENALLKKIIMGRTKEEIMKLNAFKLIHPEDYRHALKKFSSIIKGLPVNNIEYRTRAKDNSYIPISTNASPIFDQNGKIIAALGVARDISERKKAEKKIIENEQKYRGSFVNSAVGVVIADIDGNIIEGNNTIMQIMGFQEEDLNRISLKDFYLHPEDTRKTLKELEEKGYIDNIKTRFKTKAGKILNILLSIRFIGFTGIKSMLVTVINITNLKKAEKKLMENAEKYRTVIEEANDGIMIIYDSIIQYVNPAMCKMVGYSYKEYIGKPYTITVHPDEISIITNRHKKRIMGEKVPKIYESVMIDKKGNRVEVEYNVCLIPYEGDMADLTIVRNITERKKAEKELEEANQKLINKSKFATIGKLASSIAHELRNPLGVINNTAYYLNMKLQGVNGQVKKHLKILSDEVRRTNKIISELLDFTNIGPFSFIETDLILLIKNVLEYIKIPQNISLKTDFQIKILRILLDTEKIREVLQNLILNAIQSMPEGGKLRIMTYIKRNYIELIISDSGVGIPKKNLKKIFEPLFTTKKKGTGLGLSIVREIIDKHQGDIRVKSQVNVGTSFIVELPLKMKK
ncbi:MAG: PAS domain S-box protein [Promethearchaeota archaeon]